MQRKNVSKNITNSHNLQIILERWWIEQISCKRNDCRNSDKSRLGDLVCCDLSLLTQLVKHLCYILNHSNVAPALRNFPISLFFIVFISQITSVLVKYMAVIDRNIKRNRVTVLFEVV